VGKVVRNQWINLWKVFAGHGGTGPELAEQCPPGVDKKNPDTFFG
jgi:hypothetical protein